MADLRISELAALAGANLAAADLLPVVDVSASETKKITIQDAIGYGVTLIADATIPGAKILFNSGTIAGTALVAGAVGTTQLADDGVTAAKLADESTVDLVTTLPASGAYVGQLALDTDDDKLYCWTGSTWDSIKAAGSVNSVVGDTGSLINVVVTTSGDTVTISTTLDNTSGSAQFLAGPTGSAGAVSYRQIASGDLPTATTSGKGAVVVNGSGLTMSGDQVVIDNTVAASGSSYNVVQYSTKGLVTAGRAITAADLPAATPVAKGAVMPGTGLTVGVSGTLDHSNALTAGTATKVSFDAQGHITATQALLDTDIPNLPASKITTGTLSASLLGTNSITGTKLANYATVLFGGAANTAGIVTFPTADFIGQQFFDALNGDLYLYDGAAWQPITITAGELIYAGTYDASQNEVKSTTAAGTAAGLVVGNALPAASSSNLRYYVVVSDSGTGVAPAPVVALAPPDMLVSSGTAWELIDVSNGIAGQLASNISFTPSGNIAATNVQTAIQELDSEKLGGNGGTVTGALEIGTTGSLVFEGSTADAYETTLTVVDPTADRTISLPDASGTLLTTGSTGLVTSTMIADGTIVDADVNASAAIAGTKISPNFGSQTVQTTGVFSAADGTAAAPSIRFTNDVDSGLYSVGANQVAITTNGTGRLFVGSDGSVGIGASALASVPLLVQDTGNGVVIQNAASGNYAIGLLAGTGSQDAYVYQRANAPLIFGTNNAERLRITSSGNVGIGTSSPTENLTVYGTGARLAVTGASGIGAILLGNQDSVGANNPSVIAGANGSLYLGGGSSWAGGGTLDYTMTLTDDGNVGIGTTNPGAALEIVGGGANNVNTPAVFIQNDRFLTFKNTTGAWAGAASATTSNNFLIAAVNNLTFATGANADERARIDSSGRLLVGTSATIEPNTEAKIESKNGSIAIGTFANIAGNYSLSFVKSRGTTTNVTVQANDNIGAVRFWAADGTGYPEAAVIRCDVDGTPAANDMPGRLVFSTTADGAATPTERLRIASTGAFGLSGANYGTSGQVLTSGGSGAAPTWTTISAGGGGDVVLASNNAFTGANTFTNATGQIFCQAATQDAILLRGRAGGTSSRTVEIVPTTLTASRVLTAPNVSGTIVTTGDTGSVTSTMISDGTIVNGDINASAAIAGSKISPVFGAQTISNTGSRCLIGSATSITTSIQPGLQVQGTGELSYMNAGRWSTDAAGPGLLFGKSRGAAIGTRGAVTTNDSLGEIGFYGDNGTSFSLGAAIYANVDGTVSGGGAADMPGRLGFATSPDGSATPQIHFLIDKNGQLYANYPGVTTNLSAGYLARAWINFNGTGTPASRANNNVSSITDSGVGRYSINFTSAMPDANYNVVGAASTTDALTTCATVSVNETTAPTASAVAIRTNVGTSNIDVVYCNVTIFR